MTTRCTRASALVPDTIDAAARCVDVTAATQAPVLRRDARGPYLEVLDIAGCDPDAAVGVHVLNAHRVGDVRKDVLGAASAVWREAGKLCATLKIDDAAIWRRVRNGTLRFVSIGYTILATRETRENGKRVVTVTEWTLDEISFVPVAADPAATVRGKATMKPKPKKKTTVVDIDEKGHVVERDAGGRVLARSAAPVALQRAEVEETPAEETPATETEEETSELAPLREATDAALEAERGGADELAAARSARLTEIRSRGVTVRPASTRDTRSNDDPHVRAERMGEACYARNNPAHKLSEAARQYAHASTVDLARMSLRAAGMSTTGLSPDSLVTRAMQTTSDFPLALGNFTNRELRTAYDAAPSALRQAARQSTVKDFRLKQKIQVETAAKLEKVGEHGEFKHGAHVEAAESYRVDTFGKIISISRQVLVNDDLGWTADLARGLGREAAAFEARFLVDLLLANAGFGPVMADGNELFDATHGNLGVAAALGEAPLSAGRLAMRKQASLSGEIIGLGPKFLIVPSDLETAAEKLLASITPATVADANVMNFLTLLVEPRLTSATRYYLTADPAQVEGLEYAYLAGAPGPQTETKVGFEIDGVAVKVRLDFGAGFVDHRGWFMNAGA